MTRYLRMLQSAVDPADIATVRQLFADDVVPAFRAIPGCLSIELLVSQESNAGGLVEGAALSRWETQEAMEVGMASREAREAQVRIVELLRQEPVVRIWELLE